MKDKFILDACCGGKMFWFNKEHPSVIYNDLRTQNDSKNQSRTEHKVNPDTNYDFNNMDFPDKSFKLVVFDPPHLFLGQSSNFARDYGRLERDTWKTEIKEGFNECWRVLDDYGVLIFKWNEFDIPLKDILNVIGREPLFGNKQGKRLKTHWLCYMKIPTVNKLNKT